MLILELKVNPLFGVNFAGVNFLTLIDAQGSPMCTAFSAWQFINNKKRDPTVVAREYTRAMIHIRFCMELYKLQADAGRYFLHEHPASAMSWAEPEVRRIAQMQGVQIAVGDQCMYEAADKDGDPIKKPTKFMTNSACIAEALSKRCGGKLGWCSRPSGGRHALCNGNRAKAAAIYPFALCRAILTGFRDQMILDGRLKPGSVGLNCVMLDGGDPQLVEDHYFVGGDGDAEVLKLKIASDEKFVDDLTGQALDPALCRAARKKEMDFVREKGLWIKKTIKECWDRTRRPPVSVRWVETNKGDDINPNIRSRLVARQSRSQPSCDIRADATVGSFADSVESCCYGHAWEAEASARSAFGAALPSVFC